MSAVHKIWTPFPHTQSPNCSSAPCHGSNGATPLIDLSEVMLGQAFSFLYMSPDSNKMHQPSLMLSDRLAVRLYTQVKVQKQTWRAQTSAKANLVQIWISEDPDMDDFLNLLRTYLSSETSMIIVSWTCGRFSRGMSQNAVSLSAVLKNLWKFVDLDPNVDDFQSLISSSLPTGTSLVKFSWRCNQ